MSKLCARPVVRRLTTPLWLVALFCLAPVAAFAGSDDQAPQPADRSSVLAAERDKKAAETSPPERSFVEKALYRYDNSNGLSLLGNWHGVHFAGGDFPAGAGTKFGVGYSLPGSVVADPKRANRLSLDTVAAYSTQGYMRAAAAVKMSRLGGAPIDLRLRGQRYEFPQEDFFGIGPDSQTENRTNYLLESTEAGADLLWKPAKLVDLAGGVSYLTPRTAPGTDSRFPSSEQLFDATTLAGFGAQTDFLRSDASAALDWRDNPLHPHAGGRYGVQFSDFRDQDLSAFGFRHAAIDLQQYVPLPNRYRTLALRGVAVFTDPHRGQQVPFYYQPTLGGSQTLRGFREFRFRDSNSLALTAEYRWEASWLLDGALFIDAGQVAAHRRDLNLRDLDVSYGVGFRIHSNSAFVARLDLAFSREGFIPLMRFEHVF